MSRHRRRDRKIRSALSSAPIQRLNGTRCRPPFRQSSRSNRRLPQRMHKAQNRPSGTPWFERIALRNIFGERRTAQLSH